MSKELYKPNTCLDCPICKQINKNKFICKCMREQTDLTLQQMYKKCPLDWKIKYK